jgi:hypothetical protein
MASIDMLYGEGREMDRFPRGQQNAVDFRVLRVICLMALLLPAFRAQAVPVVVTAPSTLNFDFDLSGGTPSPPFGSIEIFPGFGDISAGDAYSGALFPELNSQGTSTGSCLTGSCSFNDPSVTDGVFSFSVSALNGQFSVDPGAIALTSNFRLVSPTGSPPPVTVVTSGQTIIFNFDLTGAVPGPPFSLVKIYTGWGDFSAGDAITAAYFPELNGQGPSTDCLGFNSSCDFSDPAFTDGIFSLAVTSLNGDFTVQPGAIGLGDNFRLNSPPVFGVAPIANETPLPATNTLALLVTGLLAATLVLRRAGTSLVRGT